VTSMPAKAVRSQQSEEGTVYVTSFGKTFTEGRLDAEKVSKYLENVYLAGALDKQQRTLFRNKKDFTVQGIGPDKKVDEELTQRLTSMCLTADVDGWFNSQIAWRESASWGPALFNPVWGYEGSEWVLLKLRHLPSETFQRSGYSSAFTSFRSVTNPLLPGIALNDAQQVEFWQTQLDGQVRGLKNVFMMTDPVRIGWLGGKPLIKPIIPVVTMLDFAWVGQMQQNNRLGAGGLFYIKVTNPQKNDREYAQRIIQNISRGVAYQLRENMEFVNLGLNATTVSLDTINALDKLLANYFSPSGSISKEGTLIGGSNQAEYELYLSYIEGQQSWVAASFERMLAPYLAMNGYDKYSIVFGLPTPSVDRSELYLKLVQTGFDKKTMDLNERREILSKIHELSEKTPEEIQTMAEEFKLLSGAPVIDPSVIQQGQVDGQKAAALANLMSHPLDRYGVVNKAKAQKLAEKLLGIEEGQQ
jgi:hypothetical protein